MAKSYDPKTMTYSSPRPPIHLPSDLHLSLTSFLFKSTSSFAPTLALSDSDSDSDSGKSLTFHDLKTHVSILACALLRLGIAPGDVVFIFAPNSIHFPVCFLAVAAVGVIVTTCSPLYTVFELSKQIKDSKPKLIIAASELLHKIEAFNLPSIILDYSKPINSSNTVSSSKVWYYADLIRTSSNVGSELPANGVTQSHMAALLYSSGTAGQSKGVVLTHGNFIAASVMGTADQERVMA